MSESDTEIKRWTAKRKTQVVLDLLKGKTTVAMIARQHDLTPAEFRTGFGIRGGWCLQIHM